MERRLIVMRHAKSSWHSDATSDHARPLSARGERDAPRVGAELQLRGWVPQLAISSDAIRTRATWIGLSTALATPPPVLFSRALYHGDVHALRIEAGELPASMHTLLALGHNPGWEEAVQWLSGEVVTLKTGCAALLAGVGDSWSGALTHAHTWTLVDVIRPRTLAAEEET